MTCSLIITTYNWKEALEKVLESVIQQKILPDEVIIADDGSRQDTADLIQRFKAICPIPLIHSWQEDKGFRLSSNRNKAIALANSDYIVIIDGDLILHPKFIANHIKCAKKGYIILGNRAMLNENISNRIIVNKRVSFFQLWMNSTRKRYLLSHLLLCLSKKGFSGHGVIGANMSLYKSDIVRVNGFNEDFQSWGKEDEEFVLRLVNSGVKRKVIILGMSALHIYHNQGQRNTSQKNISIFTETLKSKSFFCKNGIDKYLRAQQ